MISLDEIRQFYPEHIQGFSRFMLREYLQYKVLNLIFDHPLGKKLSFIGGSCLRIIHQNRRFSEDLDFDNYSLTEEEFDQLIAILKRGLEREGYQVSLKKIIKGAYHCHIRFPGLLYEQGLSGHIEETILIKVDTQDQAFDFVASPTILNQFDVFTTIFVTPVDLLLSQKFYAIFNRPRPKGRDFYDIVFLLAKTKANYAYLDQKCGIANPEALREQILIRIADIDLKEMARDVQRFLFEPSDAKRIEQFEAVIRQAEL